MHKVDLTMKYCIIILSVIFMTACQAFGGTFTIEWDANAENVDGYNVYTSTTQGPPYDRLTSEIGGPNVTTFTTQNMSPGNHCFVATAWKGTLESGYSNIVCGDMPMAIPANIRLIIN